MHAGRAQAVPWARGPTFAHPAHTRVPVCRRRAGLQKQRRRTSESTVGSAPLTPALKTPGCSWPSSLPREQTLPTLQHCISSEGDGGHSRPHL